MNQHTINETINATLKELTSSTIHDVPSNVSSNVPVNKKYDPLSAIDKNDTSISSNTLQVPDDHTYESSDQILDFTDSFMGDLIDGFMNIVLMIILLKLELVIKSY